MKENLNNLEQYIFSPDSFEKGHFTENTRGELFLGRTVGKNSWYVSGHSWVLVLRLKVKALARLDTLASPFIFLSPPLPSYSSFRLTPTP